MSHVRFRFLTGDINWATYGGSWVSQKFNNGDFDYWLVIVFTNIEEACGEIPDEGKYHVQINVIAPSEVSAEKLSQAFGCVGIEEDEQKADDLVKVEALNSYGILAVIWQKGGNNAYRLVREAKKEAQLCEMLFGFYMDKTENKIGTTGWEAVRGDLDSALARTICSGSIEGRILGKMHGLTAEQIDQAVSESRKES